MTLIILANIDYPMKKSIIHSIFSKIEIERFQNAKFLLNISSSSLNAVCQESIFEFWNLSNLLDVSEIFRLICRIDRID